jgi:hypothetical protein
MFRIGTCYPMSFSQVVMGSTKLVVNCNQHSNSVFHQTLCALQIPTIFFSSFDKYHAKCHGMLNEKILA